MRAREVKPPTVVDVLRRERRFSEPEPGIRCQV